MVLLESMNGFRNSILLLIHIAIRNVMNEWKPTLVLLSSMSCFLLQMVPRNVQMVLLYESMLCLIVDANFWTFYQKLSCCLYFATWYLESKRYSGASLRYFRSWSNRVSFVNYCNNSMIVQESELTSILCSPASCLMILNCIKDEERFTRIKNFVVVRIPMTLLQLGWWTYRRNEEVGWSISDSSLHLW